MAEPSYEVEPYRPTFPIDWNSESYFYRKKQHEKEHSEPGYGGAQADITKILKADLYISGQTIENLITMMGMRYQLKRRIHSEFAHLKGELQDRINRTMYMGDRVGTMVKRRSDLEKQLLQLDVEGEREEQAFWKDISMLAKELRYKLEQYRKEKVKGELF